MSESGEYFDYTFSVATYQMDLWGELKPTAILDICQEAASIHSSSMGFGYDFLTSNNLAWVLARAKVEIEQLPVWNDTIRVRTWHKRQSGLFALRDYIFYNSDDKPIIRVTTSWLIINLETRRLMRVDRVLGQVDNFSLSSYPHDAIEVEAERVDIGEDAVEVYSHHVVYSDIDVNYHVNNSRYLGWVCDSIPQPMQHEKMLKGFCINFNHESRYGEVVSLSSVENIDESVTISGSVDGRAIFVVNMRYVVRQ